MRLDEWQRYIDSEFLETAPAAAVTPPLDLQPPTETRPAADQQSTEAPSVATEAADLQAVVFPPSPWVEEDAPVDSAGLGDATEYAGPSLPHPAPPANLEIEPPAPPIVDTQVDDAVREEPPAAESIPWQEASANRERRTTLDRVRAVGNRPVADRPTGLNDAEVAPFAEYINARLGQEAVAAAAGADQTPAQPNNLVAPEPEPEPSISGDTTSGSDAPELETATVTSALEPILDAAPGAVTDHEAVATRAAPEPANAEPEAWTVVQDTYPLAATEHTLAQLRLIGVGHSTKEEQAARHGKAALLRRMCDPVLTLNEAALLLGAPVGDVAQLAAMGALTSIAPAPRKSQTGRRGAVDTGQPGFRLSDIVAYLATHGTTEAA